MNDVTLVSERDYYDPATEGCHQANEHRTHWWRFLPYEDPDGKSPATVALEYDADKPHPCWIRKRKPVGCIVVPHDEYVEWKNHLLAVDNDEG